MALTYLGSSGFGYLVGVKTPEKFENKQRLYLALTLGGKPIDHHPWSVIEGETFRIEGRDFLIRADRIGAQNRADGLILFDSRGWVLMTQTFGSTLCFDHDMGIVLNTSLLGTSGCYASIHMNHWRNAM